MTYKLIALDLDGTLKSTDKQILPKTKAILQELAKRGVVIVLASGVQLLDCMQKLMSWN